MSIAHGQLAAGDLDERMNAFYDGKYDVLVATSHRGIRAGYSHAPIRWSCTAPTCSG